MTSRKILAELIKYISGSNSLEELEEWIVSHLQEALDSKDEKLISLIDEVDALLMRLRDGEIPELDFIDSLDGLVLFRETISTSFSVSKDSESDRWDIGVTDGDTIQKVVTFNELISEVRPQRVVFG
ncbi:hypothetical protein MYX65_12910 [Acidobacteria bacterium AH-259-L09]|nr:hypothetical protein [Acidobacteria bacterium AH-259-L09]